MTNFVGERKMDPACDTDDAPWPEAPEETHDARATYRSVVADVAARAKAKLPAAVNGRLESATKLVLQHDVLFLSDGTVEVGSSSDPMKVYRLQGTACTCQDFTSGKAPEGWCQHRVAAGIAKRVQEVLAQQAQDADVTAADDFDDGDLVALMPEQEGVMHTPTPPPAPLPEAPVSITLKAHLDGHEVLVTLRGTDFASVRDQVEQATAWLRAHAPAHPAHAPHAATPQTPATSETPVCPAHGVMKKSTKGKGYYCPHKLDDESWCPTKSK